MNENSIEFLIEVLTPELAAFVFCESKEKLFEYGDNFNIMPAEVKARLDFLLKIIKHLEEICNDEGVRQWFFRPRVRLNGISPIIIFYKGRWKPEDELPQAVMRFAESLCDADVT